jgi:uncharacterized membrane protein (DUF4010 family)
MDAVATWPSLPILERLALSLAMGLFIGLERERRRKEAGLRTFGFAAILGAVGGLLGAPYGTVALVLVGTLVVLLNVGAIRAGHGVELTTSAALLVTTFVGLLAGLGHRFTPTALGVVTAALLAWKQPLAGFSRALTEAEIRSAILLAILAFVIYPGLPAGSVDPWHLVEPRAAWVTVILIAALGFVNYVLLKMYGDRGVAVAGFLGGLVNSTVAATELASRAKHAEGRLSDATYRAVVLANGAMLLRNAAILAILAPAALVAVPLPFALMIAGAGLAALRPHGRAHVDDARADVRASPLPGLTSPFSISSAVKFGLMFLALQIGGTLAHQALGRAGLYAVALAGGVVSSSSAVASAAALATQHAIAPSVAGIAAVLASVTSLLTDVPVVARLSGDRRLTRRVAWTLGMIGVLGVAGAIAQAAWLAARAH